MFSKGKLIFALVFIICFIIMIGYQYYKDSQKNKALFKGTYWVLIAVVAVMVGYVLFNKAIN